MATHTPGTKTVREFEEKSDFLQVFGDALARVPTKPLVSVTMLDSDPSVTSLTNQCVLVPILTETFLFTGLNPAQILALAGKCQSIQKQLNHFQ